MAQTPQSSALDLIPGNATDATGPAGTVRITRTADGIQASVDGGAPAPIGGGGSGDVSSVTGAGPGIVDNTDPANPIIAAQFGSDTTVQLPNSGSALVDALRLLLTLTDNTPASEDSKWSIKGLVAGAVTEFLSLTGVTMLMPTEVYFRDDPNSGIYQWAANQVAMVADGLPVAFWTAAGVQLNPNIPTNISWAGTVAGLSYSAVTGNLTLTPSDGVAGNVQLGFAAALAHDAVKGFPTIPTVAATPDGTPTSIPTGHAPFVIDTAGNKLWAYYGGSWHDLTGL